MKSHDADDSPSLCALITNHSGCTEVKRLIEYEEYDPNEVDDSTGDVPIIAAIKSGISDASLRLIKFLLKRKDLDHDYINPVTGKSILDYAKKSGNEEVINLIISSKKKVNLQDDGKKLTEAEEERMDMNDDEKNPDFSVLKNEKSASSADTFFGREKHEKHKRKSDHSIAPPTSPHKRKQDGRGPAQGTK